MCTYSGTLGNTASQNNATAVDISRNEYTGIVSIDRSLATVTEYDEYATITDTFYSNHLGNMCANGQTSFMFPYTRQIGAFYAYCGYEVSNKASFATNDTGTIGEYPWMVYVDIPCAGGYSQIPITGRPTWR